MPPASRPRGRPKSFNENPAQTRIQALDRALDVLELVARSNGLTLSQIAEGLDQSAATIYRVLSTLELRGMVESDPQDQTWTIGPAAFQLGSAFLRRTALTDRARPFMRDLMEATGETANLGIAQGDEVLFISQVETHESIRAFFPPGTRSPMYASGIGKALLSTYDETRVRRLLAANPPKAFTRKTLTETPALLAELERIRHAGYAYDDEERTDGMRCLAAPVFNAHGEAAAGISVSGPAHRLTAARVAEIGTLVAKTAQTLSAAMGAPTQG